jgi:ABC-type proline/glycine betaine transport system permease subunit
MLRLCISLPSFALLGYSLWVIGHGLAYYVIELKLMGF